MESSAEAGADSLGERLLRETFAGRAGLEYAFELCGLDFLRALDRADLLNVGRLDVLSDVTLDELEAVFRERGGGRIWWMPPGKRCLLSRRWWLLVARPRPPTGGGSHGVTPEGFAFLQAKRMGAFGMSSK